MLGFFVWFYKESVPTTFLFWWHFTRLTLRFFAISWHFGTFFKPWKQMQVGYQQHGFSIKLFVDSFRFNVVSRLVGMVIRTMIIVWGLISVVFIGLIGAVVSIAWAVLPIGLFALTLYGVWLLASPLFS
ncbi:MAG: hypothetical protein UY09_C0008G0009 [Parcubacteria group bacterium GW2011_GWA2_47_8]|nr:MAG: hypothetical protein UY09_C0008G0009 [Parcubacteria group bacterium GW2011_GWA2_47_8]